MKHLFRWTFHEYPAIANTFSLCEKYELSNVYRFVLKGGNHFFSTFIRRARFALIKIPILVATGITIKDIA